MDDIVNVAKKYITPMIKEPSLPIYLIKCHSKILKQRQEAWIKSIELAEEAYQRYWWRSRTNNWLKRHGYPMRRKRKRH